MYACQLYPEGNITWVSSIEVDGLVTHFPFQAAVPDWLMLWLLVKDVLRLDSFAPECIRTRWRRTSDPLSLW